jgi:hypothetical protein
MFGWRCAQPCGGRGKPCEPPHLAAVTILESCPGCSATLPWGRGTAGLFPLAVQGVGAQLVLRRISDPTPIADRFDRMTVRKWVGKR